jgi:hypothetical protein
MSVNDLVLVIVTIIRWIGIWILAEAVVWAVILSIGEWNWNNGERNDGREEPATEVNDSEYDADDEES